MCCPLQIAHQLIIYLNVFDRYLHTFFVVFIINNYFPQRSHEDSYQQDLDDSINAKISFIADEIHEITLGPNARTCDDNVMKNESVKFQPNSVESKTSLPCQDPKVSSEDSNLDEDIRIYLKQQYMEKPMVDVPKVIIT